MRPAVLTSPTTAPAAVIGSVGAETDTAWYRDLEKPARQPSPSAVPS